MKILVNTPSMNLLGGVASHYDGLRAFWTEKVQYNTIGKRNKNGNGIFWLPWDILKFIFKLLFFTPDVVLINPSLGKRALTRDFIFLKIAKFFGFKVAIFMHGFNLDYAKTIDKEWAKKNFNKASMIFVLANQFKEIMQSWGVSVPICLTTTKVDDALLDSTAIKTNKCNRNILCLTRIEKAKGIYETVDAFAILKQTYKNATLTFVGNGSELEALKDYAKNKNLSDIRFTGKLSGKELSKEYQNGDFFLFLSYGEGMPTVVLEAMAFGLPVFTRKVGGLADFFENGKMGYITDSLVPNDFADAMIPYLENQELTKKVSQYNAKYAKEHFMASSVAKQIENTIKSTLGL